MDNGDPANRSADYLAGRKWLYIVAFVVLSGLSGFVWIAGFNGLFGLSITDGRAQMMAELGSGLVGGSIIAAAVFWVEYLAERRQIAAEKSLAEARDRADQEEIDRQRIAEAERRAADLRFTLSVTPSLDDTTLFGLEVDHFYLHDKSCKRTNLDSSSLIEARIVSCDFEAGSFRDAVLDQSQISNSTFDRCNMRNVSMRSINTAIFAVPFSSLSEKTRQAISAKPDPNLVVEVTASEPGSLSFKGAELHGANFSWASVPGSDFKEANMKGLIATEADFSRCDFTEASLARGVVIGSTFDGATLKDTDLRNATLISVRFVGCDLTSAQFEGSILTKVDLRGAILPSGSWNGCTVDQVLVDDPAVLERLFPPSPARSSLNHPDRLNVTRDGQARD